MAKELKERFPATEATPAVPVNGTPVPEEAEDEDDGGGTGRRSDPELLVMGRMLRMLEALDEPARGRVVGWIYNRFYPVA